MDLPSLFLCVKWIKVAKKSQKKVILSIVASQAARQGDREALPIHSRCSRDPIKWPALREDRASALKRRSGKCTCHHDILEQMLGSLQYVNSKLTFLWTRSVKCSFLNTEHWDYDIKITNGFLLRTGESHLSPFWQFWLIFLKRKHDSRSRHHWKKTPDGEWQGWATSLKFWVEVSRTIQRAHLWLKHPSSHIYIWNYLSRKLKLVTILVKGLFPPSSFHKALDDCAQPSQCAPPPRSPPPLFKHIDMEMRRWRPPASSGGRWREQHFSTLSPASLNHSSFRPLDDFWNSRLTCSSIFFIPFLNMLLHFLLLLSGSSRQLVCDSSSNL